MRFSNAAFALSILILQVYPFTRQPLKERGACPVIYVVILEDDASRADARAKHMPDHLSFLERNASSISRRRDDGGGAGSVGGGKVARTSGAVRSLLGAAVPFFITRA